MSEKDNNLSLFHPIIKRWFTEEIGTPTDVQQAAWPKIAQGEHVLVTAPTGSGKTLTAFLWAINQLIRGVLPSGRTRVLYVSPLKALNNDIYRNLLYPLEHIRARFEAAGEMFPEIRVFTRSGDTPQSERRRMLRFPPEILITTPESLNLLLSSEGGRTILTDLCTVILDEIHAVVGNKRGTHLITAVERLVRLSGEFQRIALSATVRPLATVAEFIGGLSMETTAKSTSYKPRNVTIIKSPTTKKYDIVIRFPEEPPKETEFEKDFWRPLVAEFKKIISANRSTLLFVNNRKLSEKLTLKINFEENQPIAYAHHGSLSREIRTEVEKKLKAGELKAIVATNSLELGIDIGDLDEVVLVQTPPGLSSAIQRIGRAGHSVGEVSRGMIFPIYDSDLLEAAIMVSGILSNDIEAVQPIQCPLDVLAQVIISMVGTEVWDLDKLYDFIRVCYPYRNLSREQYDLVVYMLAGRYTDTRIRELKPRVSIDRIDNTIVARKGALLALYLSGGMIPDRGYFQLRHADSGALIGELDEEFVWEARIGQTFTFGTQQWKIQRITHNDVLVNPGSPKSLATPFWKGEGFNRDFYFSNKIADFLEEVNDRIDTPRFQEELRKNYHMDDVAAARLVSYLKRQQQETKTDLPHRHHLLVEFVSSGPGGVPGNQVILHTMWGGKVNRPFAMVLEAAWEEQYGQRLEVYPGNDCIILQLPHELSADELLSLVRSDSIEELLRKRLESSGFFGARFRECAGRALIITRNKIKERMPLWMSRLKSQKLLKAVQRYVDFPILLEAWRSCLQDEFDIEALELVLAELESGCIRVSECRTNQPSPMAQNMSFKQINQYMYKGDELESDDVSKLRGDLLSEIVFNPGLRPLLKPAIISQFLAKIQRLTPGYSPPSHQDLFDWVKERLAIPLSEWDTLLDAMYHDSGDAVDEWLVLLPEKIVMYIPAVGSEELVVALENLSTIATAFHRSPGDLQLKSLVQDAKIPHVTLADNDSTRNDIDEKLVTLLGQWLQFYGPLSIDFIHEKLGINTQLIVMAVQELLESQQVISGALIQNEREETVCDSENFEILLRMSRAEAVPSFKPLKTELLPQFLATYQGLANPADNIHGLYDRLEQLLAYRANARLWEEEYLPARMSNYTTSWFDTIIQEGELLWIGSGEENILFSFRTDVDLLEEKGVEETEESKKELDKMLLTLFPDQKAKYDFSTLLAVTTVGISRLSDLLWKAVWQGSVSNDTFQALRKGIQLKFKTPDVAFTEGDNRSPGSRFRGRTRFSKWKRSVPYTGNWYFIEKPKLSEDILDFEERKKDRVRMLLDRYGILFREVLKKEMEHFSWTALFRTLRIMELSGEIIAGYFFEGIPGPQFIAHKALRMLQRTFPEDTIYWMNAMDPASCCGLQIENLKALLPKRLEGTHIVYRGTTVVLISERKGKKLTIYVDKNDPQIQEIFAPLRHLLYREFQPKRRITVETINEKHAAESPYLDVLRTSFDLVTDFRNITLYRTRSQ